MAAWVEVLIGAVIVGLLVFYVLLGFWVRANVIRHERREQQDNWLDAARLRVDSRKN